MVALPLSSYSCRVLMLSMSIDDMKHRIAEQLGAFVAIQCDISYCIMISVEMQ